MELYTKKDGDTVVFLLSKVLWEKKYLTPELIGSLARGKTSKHDIDILLEGYKKTPGLIMKLKWALGCNGEIEDTDWGGVYFHDTFFGDVDIFFSRP